jgi:hypothetical protein
MFVLFICADSGSSDCIVFIHQDSGDRVLREQLSGYIAWWAGDREPDFAALELR